MDRLADESMRLRQQRWLAKEETDGDAAPFAFPPVHGAGDRRKQPRPWREWPPTQSAHQSLVLARYWQSAFAAVSSLAVSSGVVDDRPEAITRNFWPGTCGVLCPTVSEEDLPQTKKLTAPPGALPRWVKDTGAATSASMETLVIGWATRNSSKPVPAA